MSYHQLKGKPDGNPTVAWTTQGKEHAMKNKKEQRRAGPARRRQARLHPWSVDDYLRVDELPGGRGYADLAFVPKPGSALPPMVVELKRDKVADAALGQIRARDYPAALAGLGGECVLVGITYREGTDEHECRIERVELG